jgi:hypothetical protein
MKVMRITDVASVMIEVLAPKYGNKPVLLAPKSSALSPEKNSEKSS